MLESKGIRASRDVMKTNNWSIAGFICAFLMPLLGLIFSIIGLNQIKHTKEKGKGLAIAGIIISSFFTIIVFIMIFSFMTAIAPINKGPYNIQITGINGTKFSGSISGPGSSKSVEGTVPENYKVYGWPVVAVIQNQEDHGGIIVTITNISGDILNIQATFAAYGVVSVSA